MRQAKLGASFINWGGSPHRAKPNQQPVPSVASAAESVLLANKADEAYTGNTAGRRGDVPPLSDTAPLAATDAVGDGVNVPEARTGGSLW